MKREVPDREKFQKQAKGVLNKLTPNNFDKLKVTLYDIAQQYEEYAIDVTRAIYNKAWAEVKFTEMYAKLCKYMALQTFDFPEEALYR
jgi:translation initiation factor 4G